MAPLLRWGSHTPYPTVRTPNAAHSLTKKPQRWARHPQALSPACWDTCNSPASQATATPTTLGAPCKTRTSARAATEAAPEAVGQSDDEILAGAVLCAVADFWASLRHFALLGVPRRGWTQVGALHPFLRVVEGRLVCAGPASELVGPGVLPADDE